MRESIHTLGELPEDCLIYPGHNTFGVKLGPAVKTAKRMVD